MNKARLMTIQADFAALKRAETGFFAVLYRTASLQERLLGFANDEEFAERHRIVRLLQRIAPLTKHLADAAEHIRFVLPEGRGDTESFIALSGLLVDRIGLVLNDLDQKGLLPRGKFDAPDFIRQLRDARQQFVRLHASWQRVLADYDAAATSFVPLDELLDRVTPENRHGLIDWGKPVGKEVW